MRASPLSKLHRHILHVVAGLAFAPLVLLAGNGPVTFDVEERLRAEARNNNRDFNDATNDVNDDAWLLNRFRFGLTVRPSSWLKLYAQLHDVREWGGRGRVPGVNGAEGDDTFDLRQAYVEIDDFTRFPLGIAVGRQSISYGGSRLFADNRWGEFGRTFDAVKLHYQQPLWWADLLYARPVQIKAGSFDDSDAADQIGGFYLSSDRLPIQTTELYVLYRDKHDAQPDLSPTNAIDPRGTSNGPAARFTTVGVRMKSSAGKLGGWDYTTELAYQFGDLWVSDRHSPKLELRAFAAHASGGYTFSTAAWKPRFGLEYNYASGDHDPDDGKSQSFQNLFPSNHLNFGYMDEFGWRNMHNARVQLTAKPASTLDLDLNYHAFWLANTADYWFRSNGIAPVLTGTVDGRNVRQVGASRFVGQEIDFVVRWSPAERLKVEAGYSHFFSGTYLRDTGRDDDADFGYLMTTVTF